MLFAAGAASSAIDILKSLTSSGSSSATAKSGIDFSAVTPAAATSSPTGPTSSGSWNAGALSPGTFSALLAAQGQTTSSITSPPPSRSDALQSLFGSLDGDGDGKISKGEFETALGAGGTNVAKADEVFGKLDSNGDGSVSLDELGNALKSGKGHRHHAHSASQDSQQADPLLQALDGTSSAISTNSDGSTTTTMTYADGSKVTLTTPAAASAASSSYNVIERAITSQAQALATSAKAGLSVSV